MTLTLTALLALLALIFAGLSFFLPPKYPLVAAAAVLLAIAVLLGG